MLEIKNLHVEINGKEILKGISLNVMPGEIHAIMGPNGSGKSTLSKVLAGHPDYKVTSGTIHYEVNLKKKNLLELEAHERARAGIFLAYQYPVEVPGVSNKSFLQESFNQVCIAQGVEPLDDDSFLKLLKEKAEIVKIDEKFFDRGVNEDFSGGEKKRNEILQMAVLSPRLALLDETDSGLDIDSLRTVAEGVNRLHTKTNSIILVTHYQRLLNYIKPDFVHVLYNGKIIKSGKSDLALNIEEKGYDWLLGDAGL